MFIYTTRLISCLFTNAISFDICKYFFCKEDLWHITAKNLTFVSSISYVFRSTWLPCCLNIYVNTNLSRIPPQMFKFKKMYFCHTKNNTPRDTYVHKIKKKYIAESSVYADHVKWTCSSWCWRIRPKPFVAFPFISATLTNTFFFLPTHRTFLLFLFNLYVCIPFVLSCVNV